MSHQHFFQMFSFIPQWVSLEVSTPSRNQAGAPTSTREHTRHCHGMQEPTGSSTSSRSTWWVPWVCVCVCASYRVGECLLTVQQRQLSHTLHTERPEKMPHASTLRQMSLKKNYTGFTECIKRVKAIYQDQLQPASPTPSGVMSLLCTSPRTLHNRACVTITTHQTRLKGNRTTSGKIPKGLLSYESRILPEKE